MQSVKCQVAGDGNKLWKILKSSMIDVYQQQQQQQQYEMFGQKFFEIFGSIR